MGSQGPSLDALHAGTMTLDDFVDVWCYWDEPADMAVKRADMLNILQEDLDSYIWQKDALILDDRGDHLFGHIRVGESVMDEWFVVKLMLKASKELPTMSCRVSDIDGEFLAIEAADHLPSWVSPEVAMHKFWIRGGHIHLLPREPRHVDLPEALTLLRTDRYKAKSAIENQIHARLESATPQVHRASCILPVNIANLFCAFPQLVSVACEYLPPPASLELRQCANKVEPETLQRFHSQEPMTAATVRFTRAHYARVKHLRFRAPRDFTAEQWHKGGEENHVRMGSMLALGLKCAFLLNPEVTAFSWPTKSWSSSVSPALGSNQTVTELRAQPYERLRDGFNRTYGRVPAPENEEAESESWMEISRETLDAELDRRKKELDAFDVKDESFEKDFSSQLAEMMQKLSTIDGIEADDPFFCEDGGDSDSDDDGSSDDEMKQYMGDLENELLACGAAPDHAQPGFSDASIRENLIESMCQEEKLERGPASLLFKEFGIGKKK